MYGRDQQVVLTLERYQSYRELMYKELCYVRQPASCVRLREVSAFREFMYREICYVRPGSAGCVHLREVSALWRVNIQGNMLCTVRTS